MLQSNNNHSCSTSKTLTPENDSESAHILEHHSHVWAECVCVGVWVVYGAVGVAGAGAG